MCHQHVATARHRAAWQKDAKLATCGVGRVKTAFLADVPIQLDSAGTFEQRRRQTGALGDEFGDVEHGYVGEIWEAFIFSADIRVSDAWLFV